MGKFRVAAICLSLGFLLSCNETTNKVSERDTISTAGTGESTGTLQAQIPAEKSIHLFDMPDGVTEAEWSNAINEINAVIAKIGYPNAGYVFYKATGDTVKSNRYYFEGVWPAGDDYKKIHEDPEFIRASEKLTPMYDKIKAVEIYRKLKRVE